MSKCQSNPSLLSKKFSTWKEALRDDPDKDFILSGLQYGFSIIDNDSVISPTAVETENNKSALNPQFHKHVERQINQEIANGNYIIVNEKPVIVSPLSAIPKPGSDDVRLIHDFSQPSDYGVNSYATKDNISYQTVQQALQMIRPNWFLAKIDLKAAYRAVGLDERSQRLTGLKWTFAGDSEPTYMIDTRLPFGSRKSPAIFSRITQAVQRIMVRKGFSATIVYLDDFLVSARSREECDLAYTTLLSLLRSLGFQIAWNKVVDPCQRLIFLGITIDTVRGTVSIDSDRVAKLDRALSLFISRKRASRRQLEQLAGKLNWAAYVIPWGRTHIRTIFNVIGSLKKPEHKCLLSVLHSDLYWWREALLVGNNTKLIWDSRPVVYTYTDSSEIAGGAFCQADWTYCVWHCDRPDITNEHINIKELAIIREAALRWGDVWANRRVLVFTDNIATCYMINKGTSSSKAALAVLKDLSFISLTWNFSISASYIPGHQNDVADSISRLQLPGQIQRFFSCVREWMWPKAPPTRFKIANHMSDDAFYFLYLQCCRKRRL